MAKAKAKAKSTTQDIFPSMLSLNRCMTVSDGEMFSLLGEDDRASSCPPIEVRRHGFRGTMGERDVIAKGRDGSISQVRTTETARTAPGAIGLLVRFSLRIHKIGSGMTINSPQYQDKLKEFIDAAVGNGDHPVVEELSRRYARNILNGRWLWRNANLGDRLHVAVFRNGDPEPLVTSIGFGSAGFSGAYSDSENTLADAMAAMFSGINPVTLRIEARVIWGCPAVVQVHPSENFVDGKEKGDKGVAKFLYKLNPMGTDKLRNVFDEDKVIKSDQPVVGEGALRDTKIANAIRTIDTWYEGTDASAPIPVEPYGASLASGQFHRSSKNDAYTLLEAIDDQIAMIRGVDDAPAFAPDATYLLAMLVRGGVFGKSRKKEPAPKDGAVTSGTAATDAAAATDAVATAPEAAPEAAPESVSEAE